MPAEPRPSQTFNLLLSILLALGVLAIYLVATPTYIEVHGAMKLPLWPTTALLFDHYRSLAFVPLIGWASFWANKQIRGGTALTLSIALSILMLIFMIVAIYFSTVHGWPHEVANVQ